MRRSIALSLRPFAVWLMLAAAVGASLNPRVCFSVTQANSIKTVDSKIAIVHFNPRLRDLNANIESLNAYVEEAFKNGARIVVAPELATTGYSITLDQVMKGSGLEVPFTPLFEIRDLAVRYRGYVFVGIAEKSLAGKAYNSVVMFDPEGLMARTQKRGIAVWNTRGELPFEVVRTPYGDLGAIICSDSYLPDWMRILTLEGADIIVSPANWWGAYSQEAIWQTRARENGIWFIIANRWGTELDNRFNPPYYYGMNDAPSDVIGPTGNIMLSHRSMQESTQVNKILYYTVQVPVDRIGSTFNPTYTVAHRRPQAYGSIANHYYRPDMGNQSPPGLPPAGVTRVAAMTYLPAASAATNLSTLRRLWGTERADAVVLPGLGITREVVKSYDRRWASRSPWAELQKFVDRQKIMLLATTVLEKFDRAKPPRESVLIFQQKGPPALFGQIHDDRSSIGTGQSTVLLHLPHAKMAVLTGQDALFPEMATHLAKEGVDLVLIASSINDAATRQYELMNVWDRDALRQAWKTSTNHGFHLAAADAGGFGLIIQDGGGFTVREERLDESKAVVALDLDSAPLRLSKHLNAYYPFDLSALLSVTKRADAAK